MRPNVSPNTFRQCDSAPHDVRITSMEAGGDVGRWYQRQYGFIIAQSPAPKALAHVAIDVDSCPHRTPYLTAKLVPNLLLHHRGFVNECLQGSCRRFGVRDSDRAEAHHLPGPALADGSDIRANNRCNLGVSTDARHISSHDDGLQAAWNLDAAQGDTIIDNVRRIRARLFDQILRASQES